MRAEIKDYTHPDHFLNRPNSVGYISLQIKETGLVSKETVVGAFTSTESKLI